MTNLYEMRIPFSGFYHSIHDSYFDHEIERQCEYFTEVTGYDVPDSIIDLIWKADYAPARKAYAKAYADAFMTEFNLHGDFMGMDSPREYNFETDRLFVKINHAQLCAIVFMTDYDDMEQTAKDMFTSRSGFISFYDADFTTWGDIESWDHNQLYCLLMAFIETTQGEFDEDQLIDSAHLYEIPGNELYKDASYCRALDIMDYLRGRAERAPFTMAMHRANMRAMNKPFGRTPLGMSV